MRQEISVMKDLTGGIIFLIVMLIFVNVGGIVRLNFFNNLPWQKTKKILIIANGVVVVFFVGFYLLRLFQWPGA